MSALLSAGIEFAVPPELSASAPPEVGGGRRDDVRMLVAERATGEVRDSHIRDLPRWLRAGDALVVNVSQTVPAAVAARSPDGIHRLLHVATPLPGTDRWIVEPRRRHGAGTAPDPVEQPGGRWVLPAGGRVLLEQRYPDDMGTPRLWVAQLELPGPLLRYLEHHGEPVRYGYVRETWPISAYRTTYGYVPGSAEMPSAGRPITGSLLREVQRRGVTVAPIILHCGLSSSATPLPERFRVPAETAAIANSVRRSGGRIVAVGTTTVRALETATDDNDETNPAEGSTDLVIGSAGPVRSVDAILSGWHDTDSSHLDLLTAIAGPELLRASYRAALARGYRWHEFGDLHLVIP
jgi:S-adenosylmethionine:tRNA ribosyltransferase-isomerase